MANLDEAARQHVLQKAAHELDRLEHKSLETTMIYTHVARQGVASVTSPLDLLEDVREKEIRDAVEATHLLGGTERRVRLKQNNEKPRKRGYADNVTFPSPAVNGGPRTAARKRP